MLRSSRTPQGSIHVERVGQMPQHGTIYDSGEEEFGNDSDSEENTLYAIGSLTKFLVALLMSIIIDQLSLSKAEEHKRYRALRDISSNPWNCSFTTLFNAFSPTKIATLPQDPSLWHILLHYNSLPPMNHVLLDPYGRSLMSKESFLRIALGLARVAYGSAQENRTVYGNAGYIFVGIFIESIAEKGLESVMEEHLFKPLEMSHSCLGAPDPTVTGKASPYTYSISVNGRRATANIPLYPVGNIMNAAMGAWSCTKDLANLFRSLQACINGGPSPFKKDSVSHFLLPIARLDNTSTDAFSLCGLCTTLDSSRLGSGSINRLLSPDNICSTYRIGKRPNGKRVTAYYSSGQIEGYSSCFYYMPKLKSFVIVLTNSTAKIDSADHISRLLLQEAFDLERKRRDLVLLAMNHYSKTLSIHPADWKKKVDVVEMSARAAVEAQNVLNEFEIEDAQKDVENAPSFRLEGTYYNEDIEQSIIIKRREGILLVNIQGMAGTSQDIRLIRTGDETIRLAPLSDLKFAIDRYDPYGWRELNFALTVEKDATGNQMVVCLRKRSVLFLDKFTRTLK